MSEIDRTRVVPETVLGAFESDPQLLGLIDDSARNAALLDPRTVAIAVDDDEAPLVVPIEYATEANQGYFDTENAYFLDWLSMNEEDVVGLSKLTDFIAGLAVGAKIMLEKRENDDYPVSLLENAATIAGRRLYIDPDVFDPDSGSMAAVEHFVSDSTVVDVSEGHYKSLNEAYESIKFSDEWEIYKKEGVEFANGEDIDAYLAQELWDVYDKTFDKLVENHPSAQKQPREYFEQQLLSPESKVTFVRKDGRIVSALFVIDDVKACPWLNEEFYRKHGPGGTTAFVSGVSTSLSEKGMGYSRLTMGAMTLIAQHVPDIKYVATQCTNRSATYIPDLSKEFTEDTIKLDFERIGAYQYPVFIVG